MEADQIIPWSKGGKTIEDNCQFLCIKDHHKKICQMTLFRFGFVELKKKSTPEVLERTLPLNKISEPYQKRSRRTGRKIYKANYGKATPEEVAKAILIYRR